MRDSLFVFYNVFSSNVANESRRENQAGDVGAQRFYAAGANLSEPAAPLGRARGGAFPATLPGAEAPELRATPHECLPAPVSLMVYIQHYTGAAQVSCAGQAQGGSGQDSQN